MRETYLSSPGPIPGRKGRGLNLIDLELGEKSWSSCRGTGKVFVVRKGCEKTVNLIISHLLLKTKTLLFSTPFLARNLQKGNLKVLKGPSSRIFDPNYYKKINEVLQWFWVCVYYSTCIIWWPNNLGQKRKYPRIRQGPTSIWTIFVLGSGTYYIRFHCFKSLEMTRTVSEYTWSLFQPEPDLELMDVQCSGEEVPW